MLQHQMNLPDELAKTRHKSTRFIASSAPQPYSLPAYGCDYAKPPSQTEKKM
jgi:hypothetical protein